MAEELNKRGAAAENKPRKPAPQFTSPPRNRAVTVPAGYLAVGYVVGVHGLRGEVKVELHTDFPERFTPQTKLFVSQALVERQIVSARTHKGHLLLQLEGVVGREQADALRGTWLFVREEDAVALDDDMYWVHDIVGLTVQTEAGETLGTIQEVIFTGANEVYVIKTLHTVNRGKELLLPAIPDVIRLVDLQAKQMTVHLLPGLLDE